MADEKKEASQIRAFDRRGEKITIDKSEIGKLYALGGRVANKDDLAQHAQEEAEQQVQARYDALPTGRKVLGGINTALGSINPLTIGASPDAPPEIAAYGSGIREGATAGLYDAGVRKIADAVGGQAAGDQYAMQTEQQKEASPVAHGLGSFAGLVGASALGSSGGPVGLLSRGGDAIEAGLAGTKAVSNLAARGAMGKAAAAAITMAARGGAEGALYNLAEQAGQSITATGSLDGQADKLLAAFGTGALIGAGTGAVLGGLTSLAGSGLKALRRSGEDVPRPLPAAEGAAIDEASMAAMTESPKGSQGILSAASDDGLRELAHDRAWRATQGRRVFAERADKYLPRGTKDVGEAMNRYQVVNRDGAFAAAREGTPAALEARFDDPIAFVGSRIGEIAENSGARIASPQIVSAIDAIAAPLGRKAGFEGVEASVLNYKHSLLQKLGVTSAESTVPIQDLIFQRRTLDDLIYKEAKALDPGGRVGALREVRGQLEGLIETAMDEASGKVPGALKAEYKSLKHDYQALSIGRDATSDAVSRGSANRTFSLTDKIIGSAGAGVGAMVGGPVGSLVAGPAAAALSKTVRERGDALLAYTLQHLADSGVVSKLIARVDDQITAASRGLIVKPAKGLLPERGPIERPRVVALSAMKQIAALQADPTGTIDAISKQTEALGATNPELATAMTQRMASSLSFLASKMPVSADPDPLDPHQAPHMTDGQAAEFSRYVWYTEKPERFFAEAAVGKLTPEGAETAQALMPQAFAELQSRTLDAIATHMSRGRSIPFEQRLKIGQMLDIPATPSQQPDHARLLQQNVVPLPKDSAAPATKRSAKSPSQQSALDRLEASGPGHR